MKLKSFTYSFKTSAFKRGSGFFLSIAVSVITVIALNIGAAFIPSNLTRFDTTNQRLFTMSEETKSLLDGLTHNINIYHLCTKGIEDDNISELLMKYASSCEKISVSVIDTSIYPNFYKDYADDSPSDNSLIISGEKRSRVIDFYEIYTASSDNMAYYGYYDVFNGEKELTSAIDYVSTDRLPKIYLLEGHGEDNLSEELQKEIKVQNFELSQLSLNGLSAVPNDADCVMLFSPDRDIAQSELEMLLDYEKNGGRLLIAADYDSEETPVFDQLLKSYGLSLAEGIVFENDSNGYVPSYPYFIYPRLISHTITEPLVSKKLHTLFPLAMGIVVSDEKDDSITVETLVSPSETAYSKVDVNSENQSRTENDLSGPFSFAVAAESQNGKMVLFSTTQFLDSSVNKSVAGANYDLFLNSIAWLCQKENSIAIHSKNLLTTSVAVSHIASSIMFVILVIAVPGIFLLISFITIRRRRQR